MAEKIENKPDHIPKKGAVDDVLKASGVAAIAGDLARNRQILFRSWMRDASKIRGQMTGAAREADSILAEKVAGLASDVTRIPTNIVGDVYGRATRIIDEAFTLVENNITSAVRASIKRSIANQAMYLKAAGLKALSERDIEAITRKVFQEMTREFPPGSGIRYFDRIRAIKRKHEQQLRRVLSETHPAKDALTRVSENIRVGLSYTKPARTPLRGGSASKELQRLLIAEESRLSNLAEVATMKRAGVSLAYWRLNAAHRDYGGGEICEILASGTGDSVLSVLDSEEHSLAHADLAGLYTVDEYPMFPHPFCMCFPEPYIIH